jgi:23S rRNA-/tRNA-specific pseudouridylate synthase
MYLFLGLYFVQSFRYLRFNSSKLPVYKSISHFSLYVKKQRRFFYPHLLFRKEEIFANNFIKNYCTNDNINSVTGGIENVSSSESINKGLNGEVRVIYFDDDIIVVDKPSFAQTAPGFIEKDSLATIIILMLSDGQRSPL